MFILYYRSFITQLADIHSPSDIKSLSLSEQYVLCAQLRKRIIDVVGKNGGHLSSNLGVVELTLALHLIFDSPKDAIIWDVSHQCYTHKLLTGRYESFDTLRKKDGLSGFTKHGESEHDFFDCGHSSTSISSALGLLTGRKLQNIDGKVIAVIGDGALTGGMALEALSHAGQIAKNLIVVLNDNQMSIGKNTGSLSRYLSRLTMTSQYQSFRYNVDRAVNAIPRVNKWMTRFIFRFKKAVKALVFTNNLFVDLGFEYVGPLNGHNLSELENVFSKVKQLERPVVIHVVTQKGRGYRPAEDDPVSFHGTGPFCVLDGKGTSIEAVSFTEVFSRSLVKIAAHNPKVVAITAAMAKGTGLSSFAKRYPSRFFDVGIAEQHAVTFAGGLSAAGLKPVVAIYSTFMQRAIDQLIHDISLQNIPAVFVLDRSGPVPDDGETHQGIFDISLMRPVPNLSLLAPASAAELVSSLLWATEQNLPVVIRYPKACCPSELDELYLPIENGKGVLIKHTSLLSAVQTGKEGEADTLIVCTGGLLPEAVTASRCLAQQNNCCDIYNLRFLKPLNKEYFIELVKPYSYIVFVEDGVRIGGIGTFLESLLQRTLQNKKTAVCGFPDRFLAQGKRQDILEEAHLSSTHIIRKILELQQR